MAAIGKVLVIGGGIAGMSSAIALRRDGIDVDLIEADQQWRAYGAGITITGPTLRAFRAIGILEEVGELGFYSQTDVKLYTKSGEFIANVVTPRLDSDLPPYGAIMRPTLHNILSRKVLESGTTVRLGITAEQIDQAGGGAAVRFSDQTSRRYDLVIGADGIGSRTVKMIFPDAPKPQLTGQSCWRVTAPRPPELQWSEFFLGGNTKVGVNPCSPTEMYLFALVPSGNGARVDPSEFGMRLKAVLAGFGGSVKQVCESIGPDSQIVYRPLEARLLARPWSKGAAVVIGDAAHATTPHLASGAGIAMEDGIVLAQTLKSASDIPSALEQFVERRFDRARTVVESSLRLGELELSGGSPADFQQVMEGAMQKLAEPI